MLPVLSAAQVRLADAHTIAHEPIASADLMERAATRACARILHHLGLGGWAGVARITVFAGMGNNGGDGLVIARLLHQEGYVVNVHRIVHRAEPSADHALVYRKALDAGVRVVDVREGEPVPETGTGTLVIDALFGTGLDRPLTGFVAQVVRAINASGSPVIAIDLPSGLFAEDNRENDPKAIVRARTTLTFQTPKLALLLADGEAFAGGWEVVDIGLDETFVRALDSPWQLVEQADVLALLRPRTRFAHKGTHGHALVMAGGPGCMGAAVLAARAALRSGAGLVTARVPGQGAAVLQTTCPEALCLSDPNAERLSELPAFGPYDAIAIGPGIGTAPPTATVLKRLLQEASVPVLIDADALNLLAEEPTWTAFLPPGTVLTPHPGEFDRLHGSKAASGYERLVRLQAMALRYGRIIVLKGAFTAVATPGGKVFFNPTGNPGMAKGGSGDVLTGLLVGLLAQGYPLLAAALLGVYLHGLAGDIAARHKGMDGMTAMDSAQAIAEAWRELRNASEESVNGAFPFADQ